MKLGRVTLRIGTLEDFRREISERIGKPTDGRSVRFIQPQFAHRFFSKRRMELLAAIAAHPEANVTALSRLLKRKQPAISRDLAILKLDGLVVEDSTPAPRSGHFSLHFTRPAVRCTTRARHAIPVSISAKRAPRPR